MVEGNRQVVQVPTYILVTAGKNKFFVARKRTGRDDGYHVIATCGDKLMGEIMVHAMNDNDAGHVRP